MLAADIGEYQIGNFLVAQQVEEGVVGLPASGHIDIQVIAKRLDDGAAGFDRLGHDDGENAQDIVVGQRQQPGEDARCGKGIAVAAGDRASLLRLPQQRQDLAPPSQNTASALQAARLAATASLAVRCGSRRTCHRPEPVMGGPHQAQRDTRTVEHGRARRGMAMQIDMVLHRPGEFRSRRL